jgi:uncharacterized protein
MGFMQRASKKAWLAALLPLATLGASGLAFLDTKQRELIFRPVKQPWEGIGQTDLGFQELWIPLTQSAAARDNIYAWWLPAECADAPAILFLHGACWNLSWHVDRISKWRAMGFSVLGIDYRGFGHSPGDLPTEAGVYEDAQRGWEHLRQLAPYASQRVIYGHSLGGAIAIELATRYRDMDGVIVESTFTSIRDMARVQAAAARWLPVRAILNHRFDSLAKVGKLDAPILFLHGTSDEVVPHRMSEALYAAARAPKQLVLFPELGHSNIPMDSFPQYQLAVRQFVDRISHA